MARPRAGIVYIGLKAMVVALDRRTGTEIWRTKLTVGVGRSSAFVTLYRDDDILFAGVGGELFALDPKSGMVLWHNPLKGFGYGISSIAGDTTAAGYSGPPPSVAEIKRQRDAAASG